MQRLSEGLVHEQAMDARHDQALAHFKKRMQVMNAKLAEEQGKGAARIREALAKEQASCKAAEKAKQQEEAAHARLAEVESSSACRVGELEKHVQDNCSCSTE